MEHVKIRNVLDRGDLINKIVKIVEEEGINYVVMGTKGATSLKETFLGTATTKVMNDSKAVVLAIPENCEYQQIEKILTGHQTIKVRCHVAGQRRRRREEKGNSAE